LPDRVRMNIAHELGHLLLHKQITGGTREQESEAYRLAAELRNPAKSGKCDAILFFRILKVLDALPGRAHILADLVQGEPPALPGRRGAIQAAGADFFGRL